LFIIEIRLFWKNFIFEMFSEQKKRKIKNEIKQEKSIVPCAGPCRAAHEVVASGGRKVRSRLKPEIGAPGRSCVEASLIVEPFSLSNFQSAA
jgi:hypothetical protein